MSVSFLSVRTLEDEMIEITDVEATVTFTEGKWRWRDKVGEWSDYIATHKLSSTMNLKLNGVKWEIYSSSEDFYELNLAEFHVESPEVLPLDIKRMGYLNIPNNEIGK